MKKFYLIMLVISAMYSVSAQSWHFKHFIFDVPEGWKVNEQNDFLIISPQDLAPNESLSYIFLAPVDETNFEKTALEILQDMAAGLKGTLMIESYSITSTPNIDKELSGKSFKGWEYYKCFGHVRAPVPNDPYSSTIYELNIFLVKINSRMERLVLMSKDVHNGIKESTSSRNPKYAAITNNFCFNLEFDDWKDAPYTNGKVIHHGISSVWNGLNYYINGQSVVFSSTLQKTFLIFFDNGQVYFNSKFPEKGLDELNTLTEAEWNPQLWGTYQVQKGIGSIKLPFATMPFSISGDKLIVEYMKSGHEYVQNPSVDNTVFNGTWCGNGEAYGSSTCISFNEDGRFTDNGVVRALEHSVDDYYVATPQKGTGNYSVRNNSIIFRFSTGLVFKTAFTGKDYHKDDRSPKEISFGSSDTKFVRN